MKVLLANPHGFCAGVVMAVETLERTLELVGSPLYVFHEIVHNRHVVERFTSRGVVFVDDVDDVPEGAWLIFSAHGVAPEVRRKARERRLQTIDATCPLVHKVHIEAVRFAAQGYTIILIGHAGHDESIGTLGEAPDRILLVESTEDVDHLHVPDPERVAYLTQTTLSVDDAERIIRRLRQRFPHIVGPSKDDICYATQNRQEAVKTLLSEADAVLVIGSANSSNSNRLVEIARGGGKPAYLIDAPNDINPSWLAGRSTILLTAGASAPEETVDACLDYLQREFGATVESRSIGEERAHFALPRELQQYEKNLNIL